MKLIIAAVVLVAVTMFATAGRPILSTEPTVENALAADQELARAIRENDTTGIVRMLDKTWAVITTFGDVAEGPDIFPSGIRTGYRVVKAMEVSEPRVRLYGNVAIVTSKVRLAGDFAGKPFDVMMRQTDVLRWEDGKWKCILTHESKLGR
jgi:ketosteroid isomerase-like protein